MTDPDVQMYNDTLRRTLAEDNDRMRAEIARLCAALEKIGAEQSHVDAQVAAGLFQKIAREALK